MSFMHFTTQQLQGGGKYSVKAKIGNWYEDMVMDETKFKDYISLKEANGLLVSQKEDKYANMLSKLPLTPFQNGFITTGNYFMLKNLKTQGCMVIDIDDKNLNYSAAFAVTTSSLIDFPCPRSLFKIEKYTDKKQIKMNGPPQSTEPSVVRYGDKIVFVAYPAMYKNPLYLFSTLITPLSYSRFSRNQEVLANEDQSYNNCWCLEHPDATLRYSVEGKPIEVNQPFIVKHCATGASLASDLVNYLNDYGNEYEISCRNYLTPNKYQTIEAEKDGRLRIDTKTRVEYEQNIWTIVDKSG